jgi:hypothetical protein
LVLSNSGTPKLFLNLGNSLDATFANTLLISHLRLVDDRRQTRVALFSD